MPVQSVEPSSHRKAWQVAINLSDQRVQFIALLEGHHYSRTQAHRRSFLSQRDTAAFPYTLYKSSSLFLSVVPSRHTRENKRQWKRKSIYRLMYPSLKLLSQDLDALT